MSNYNPNHLVIYLAGYIAGEVIDQCVGWRNKVIEHYMNWKDQGIPYPIVFLSPCNGENFSEITPNGLKGCFPSQAIFHKDYTAIEKSDLIVANMDTFGMTRPPVGTISELTIAWTMHKPIILITNDIVYKEHPFIKYFTSWQIDSVDELLEKKVINQFYKALHSTLI